MTMSATLRTLTLTTLGAASIACPVLADEPLPDVVRFNRDIRPILSDNCVACHGPDAKHRKGDLRLDVEADAKAKHDDVFAIKPGDLAGSEVWKRITSKEKDEVMPPPSAKKTLTPRQIALLKHAHKFFLRALRDGAIERGFCDAVGLRRLKRLKLHRWSPYRRRMLSSPEYISRA